jgi:anaerobic magnesium-protoporphyrin IX monomethyl ester cyclase
LKVLLINPPVFRVDEPWYDTPDFVRTGLAYLAGYLREYPDFEIKIIDSKFERLNFEQTLKIALDFKPDLVGLCAFTNEIKPAAYMAKLLKEKNSDLLTVIGGVHVTALPVQTLEEFPEFDIGVIGEGEVTFHELCFSLQNKKSLENINGLSLRHENEIFVTPPRERILDQNSIPFPAWDLLPSANMYIVMSQRGCPFNCVFCMNPNGRVARKRTADNVIEELDYLIDNFNPKTFMFGDELFSVDMDRTAELLKSMIEHNIHKKIEWTGQTHVRFVDVDLFNLMRESNCSMMGMGIESGDEEKLKTLGKGTNLDMVYKAREAARIAKVPIETYFILGQPDETIESMNNTIDLAVKINPDLPIFGIMSPYPGTEIARLAAKGEAGYRLATTDWNEYNKQLGGALEFANLSRRQIEIMQIKAYSKVFLYNHRYLDFIKFVWHYRVGAWSVLKKVLGFKQKTKVYEVGNKMKQISLDSDGRDTFIDATKSWQKWQIKEASRARKEDPKGIKIKHV